MSAKFVAAFDFGTTFSGIAYARKSHPDDIHVIERWPLQDEATHPYCKTTTSLWYVRNSNGEWQCKEWGWPAVIGHSNASMEYARHISTENSKFESSSVPSNADMRHERTVGRLVTRFKLHLAEEIGCDDTQLPDGISVQRTIMDFFLGMSFFVLEELRRSFGSDVQMSDIEWVLTVPAIWTEKSKQKMRKIAIAAGLAPYLEPDNQSSGKQGHPLHIVLEPEAASSYCHHKAIVDLKIGDKIMVVDCGGGTVDIVVHEKAGNGAEVKEVTRSNGSLCGSTYIDDAAFRFLENRIGCLKEYMTKNQDIRRKLMRQWDDVKRTFKATTTLKVIEIPHKLATEWKKWEKEKKLDGSFQATEDFDEVILTKDTLKSIFDPTVDQVLELIADPLSIAGTCQAMLVVGGFSESHYLQQQIRKRFSEEIKNIVTPPNPGAAICHGAVLQILHPERVLSRISRKTYGIHMYNRFLSGVHPESKKLVRKDGTAVCTGIFDAYVTIGDSVNVNSEMQKVCYPESDQKQAEFALYSTTKLKPGFVDEPDIYQEGRFTLDIPDTTLGKKRKVAVTMWFGRSSIEVKARPLNFGNGEEASSIPIDFDTGDLKYRENGKLIL